MLKGESEGLEKLCGSHRIQRVPATEKKGRRHSSSVTVAILEEGGSAFVLDPSEVKIETARGSGKGGQHRNKTDSCVTAIHQPTGHRVRIDGRKQGQNKKKALTELERRLFEKKEFWDAVEENVARIEQASQETFRWVGWRDEVIHHASGRRTSMSKALKGKLDPLLTPADRSVTVRP